MKSKHILYDQFITGVNGLKIAVYSERYYQLQPHVHEEYEIMYVKKGTLLLEIGDERFYAPQGSVYFVQPNTSHAVLVDENTTPRNMFHYYLITFSSSMLGNESDLTRRFFESIKIDKNITLSSEALELFPKMRKWDIEKTQGYEIFLKSGLLQILAELVSTNQYISLHTTSSSHSNKKAESISNVTNYIENHYQEELTVSTLSNISGYSESHLYRIFKEQLGMSISEYINKYRIDKACTELLYSEKTITQIAICCGFTYIQNFSRTFRRYMGLSPIRYRKRALGFKKTAVSE